METYAAAVIYGHLWGLSPWWARVNLWFPWEWFPSGETTNVEDLKNANPSARISVKLVARIGIGVIASGVTTAWVG